jgi:PAS domain S-box-containing protein
MTRPVPPKALTAYVALLFGALVLILAATLTSGTGFRDQTAAWLFLTLMLALTEYLDLTYHDQNIRFGLSAAEAVYLPMLMGFPFTQAVWGAVIAITAVRLIRWRAGALKAFVNIAAYGCAAATAASVWHALGAPAEGFTPINALAGVASALTFALMTHLFITGVLAILQERSFITLTRAVGAATLLNLAGNITLGLLFAASFFASPWTVLLFPLPLSALFLGYRAVLRQSRERQRVEHLHSASRALAASADLDSALTGFLSAVREIASADEARVLINMQGKPAWTGVRESGPVSDLAPVDSGPMLELLKEVKSGPGSVLLIEDVSGIVPDLAVSLDARSLIAVPLTDGEDLLGCLAVLDRIGAEEFDDSDVRLMEALGNELVRALDAYRLFDEVSEERERFRRIFFGSKEGIALIDDTGCVRAWNPVLHRLSGYPEEEVLERVWSDLVVLRDGDQHRLRNMDITTVSPDDTLELVTREGPARWVTITAGPVQSAEDKSWVILIRDVTSEHEAEEAKSDFLSTISHELRTPLTSIKGSLQVLGKMDELPAGTADQMVGVMRRGADRLERLVMNLLAVSQLDTGVMTVFPEAVSISDTVMQTIGTTLASHPNVHTDLPEGDLEVRADRERLAHVLEHLMENALKFGGPDGNVTVKVTQEGGWAHIVVSDEGPGIASADRQRIFDRFVRLGSVLTRETQGAGVGLFIAKRSVEAMHGEIWVESQTGRGSEFHVRIPLARPIAMTGDSA